MGKHGQAVGPRPAASRGPSHLRRAARSGGRRFVCHPDLIAPPGADRFPRAFDRAGPVYGPGGGWTLPAFDPGRWLAPAGDTAPRFPPVRPRARHKCIGAVVRPRRGRRSSWPSIIARWNLPPRARACGCPPAGRAGPGSRAFPVRPSQPCAGFPLRVDRAGPDLRELSSVGPPRTAIGDPAGVSKRAEETHVGRDPEMASVQLRSSRTIRCSSPGAALRGISRQRLLETKDPQTASGRLMSHNLIEVNL